MQVGTGVQPSRRSLAAGSHTQADVNRRSQDPAALPLPGGGAIGATSSLTGVLIAQMLVAEVCGTLLRIGKEVPVLVSANVPGGDEHNEALSKRYGGRLRRSEP